MIVREAHRTRHLDIRLDRGDELPGALVRALDEAEARSGFVTGTGTLEAAVLRNADQTTYRLDAPSDVVSLSGPISVLAGATSLQLSALLSRATDIGLSTFGGHLTWARARAIELHAVIFDELALARVEDAETGLPVLDLRAVTMGAHPSPARPAVTSALARLRPTSSRPAEPPPLLLARRRPRSARRSPPWWSLSELRPPPLRRPPLRQRTRPRSRLPTTPSPSPRSRRSRRRISTPTPSWATP